MFLKNQRDIKNAVTFMIQRFILWAHTDLNCGPPDYESGALTN